MMSRCLGEHRKSAFCGEGSADGLGTGDLKGGWCGTEVPRGLKSKDSSPPSAQNSSGHLPAGQ